MINSVVLKENYEFRRMYKKGKSFVNPALVVYILKNKKGVNRIGITTSKKIGKAVMRNRARRVIREAYRQLEVKIPQTVHYDFVFVARGKTTFLKTGDIQRAMNGIFASAKVYEPTSSDKTKPENQSAKSGL